MSEQLLLMEEQPATREGLVLAIRAAMRMATIVVVGSSAEAQAKLAAQRFDMIVYDFSWPDNPGLPGVVDIVARAGDARVFVVCARCDAMVTAAVRSIGAAGLVDKADTLGAITTALRRVSDGETHFPERRHEAVPTGADQLSAAQFRVLSALGKGRLNKQIAGDLGVTEATIKAHLSAIFRKLGVTNRTQALLATRTLFGQD